MKKAVTTATIILKEKVFYEILNLKTFYLFSEIGGHGGHRGHRILLYYFLLLYFQNSKRI